MRPDATVPGMSEQEPRPTSYSRVSLGIIASGTEANLLGNVHGGDIIKTYAQVNWAGTSSMEIGVRVEAQPWGNAADAPLHVASAYFVFVAVDEDGRSRQVPPLAPETPSDLRRQREAEIRRAHRLARKAEIDLGREE